MLHSTHIFAQNECVVCHICRSHLLLWKGHPLKCNGFPVDLPVPFSPVQRARKFSAVLGVMSANSSRTIRPAVDKQNNNLCVIVLCERTENFCKIKDRRIFFTHKFQRTVKMINMFILRAYQIILLQTTSSPNFWKQH